MAITAYDADKGYVGLSLKWDTGVHLKCPCCLIVDTPNNIYLLGIFESKSAVTKWKDDDFRLDKQTTVAAARKVDTEKKAATEWDKFLVEKLTPYNGKIVNVKINLGDPLKAMWDDAKAEAADGDDSWYKQYFTVEESSTSAEFQAKLEEIKGKLPSGGSGGSGGRSYVSDKEKAAQRLTFLDENYGKFATVVGDLLLTLKYNDSVCFALSDTKEGEKKFNISQEFAERFALAVLSNLFK